MDWKYESEYRIVKIVSIAFIATVLAFTLIAELLIRSNSPAISAPLMEGTVLRTIRYIFSGLATLMLICGLALKMRIRDPQEGTVLNLIRALIKNMHKTRSGSAIGLLLVISGLFETISVLGIVQFFFSGGIRVESYPLLTTSLLAMIITFPKPHERDNLITLDKEVQAQNNSN